MNQIADWKIAKLGEHVVLNYTSAGVDFSGTLEPRGLRISESSFTRRTLQSPFDHYRRKLELLGQNIFQCNRCATVNKSKHRFWCGLGTVA
jgi:hypothetical protein